MFATARFVVPLALMSTVAAFTVDAADRRETPAGSGDFKAGKLESRDATVSIAGSGDVRYYGDPAILKVVVGSGSVRRAGASPS